MEGTRPGNPNWAKGGASPNPNGRPRKERALSALLRQVGNRKDDDGKPNKLALAEMLWDEAINKHDLNAARIIYEYTDGKPVQRQEITGDSGGPVLLKWEDGARN